MSEMQSIGLKIDRSLLDKVDKAGRMKNLNRSEVVREALIHYFAQKENDVTQFLEFKCECGFFLNTKGMPEESQKRIIKEHKKTCEFHKGE